MVKVFPPIRVWGTIGFIVAMWITNLTGSKANANQFIIGGVGAIILGLYAFTLPKCPPLKSIGKNSSWTEQLGLNAFKLFTNYKMALFFVFSMFLGAALQLTNMYGDSYISSFEKIDKYKLIIDSFEKNILVHLNQLNNFWDKLSYFFQHLSEFYPALIIKYSTVIMSISQISETLFILTIPFFLKKFGIKKVMLFSMLAWVLRFGLFAYGDPAGGLWMIILSCIVYGMAFDFFNISGSLFIETSTDAKIRSSAQGMFMMMTNGFGAYLGSIVSSYLIGKYFILPNHATNWTATWLAFAIYAFIVGILFLVLFKHKHDPKVVEQYAH